ERRRHDGRSRQARARRHEAPAPAAGPVARDAPREELCGQVPLRVARVPASMRRVAFVLAAGLVLALPAQGGTRLQPVPILMYHVISSPPSNAPYPELYVPRASFAAQVAWLASHGYHAVTLQRVFDSW